MRPIFHHRDDAPTGHIVACFLALRLEVDLQRRLDERQVDGSWLGTDLRGSAYAFAAAGVRPPALVTPLDPAPTASPPSSAQPKVEVPA